MEEILNEVMNDARYLKNIEYGKPRSGHPEGKIKLHILDLEENLKKLAPRISIEQFWKLKFLIHVHDTFKVDAVPNVKIESPNSHASLARSFAAEFTNEVDLLNMIQYHDVIFSLWRQFSATNNYYEERLDLLIETIDDWELFLLFMIVDGCAKGKNPNVLPWFFREVEKRRTTYVDETWIL